MSFISTVHAQETVPSAATTESAGSGGVAASLGLNGTLFFFQLINFAVVAAIIWFLILKPLTKKMTERQKMIDDSIDNAKKIQDTLARGEQKYQERVDQAKVEANKILEKATKESEQLGARMKEKAKGEIDLLIDQAKRNIKIERDDAMTSVKHSAADLVTAALEKILSEKMTGAKDKQFIEEMLKKL